MARNLFAFLAIYEELYSINQIKKFKHYGNKDFIEKDKDARRNETGWKDCLLFIRTAMRRVEKCQQCRRGGVAKGCADIDK